ncbi:MAG TPA: T9SS type A sorting domain-containing protein, partial [Rubricoccaceae bacterium]|nr:T9SS type A sorting domain-containing protein [Rubricoccaceae bacterium]
APAAPLALAVSPNPVRGAAAITLTLARPGAVRVSVFDALGKPFAVVLSGARGAGRHEATFDASALAPGVYFVRAEAGGVLVTRPLTVLR